MTDRLADQEDENQSPTIFLLIDSLAFWCRNQGVFWLVALPIAGLAAAVTYLLEAKQQFADLRNHWGWDFLFALIYAMFLDRWIKVTLLEEASPCEEVDNLRHAIVAPRFLALAAILLLLAVMLSWVQLVGIADTLTGWGAPTVIVVVGGTVLNWLPHVLLWATLFSGFALALPALSAGEPMGLRQSWRLGRPVRRTLFTVVFGAALLSLVAMATTAWGLQLLPNKPWAPATMAAAWRLVDCLLVALVGYALASLWRRLADWQPPEPEDRPYRGMGKSRRKAA